MSVGCMVRPNPQEPKDIVKKWALAAFLLATFLKCLLASSQIPGSCITCNNCVQ